MWDRLYYDDDLIEVSDNIFREWQSLTGMYFLDKMYETQDLLNYDMLRMRALDASYRIKHTYDYAVKVTEAFGTDEELTSLMDDIGGMSSSLLERFKFKGITSVNDMVQKHKQIEQKLIDKKEEDKKKKKQGEVKFYDLIMTLKKAYPKVDFSPDITCEEYASWYNDIKSQQNG